MPQELLGEVQAPSGVVLIVDTGLLGSWSVETPRVTVAGVPKDRALQVFGARMNEEPFAQLWRTVSLEVQPAGKTARTIEAGSVPVDFARLMFIDSAAVARWEHEQPTDGRADFVFWGRDAAQAAAQTNAPKLSDGQFGWVDLEVAAAVTHGRAVEALRGPLKFATDFRPHSHHFHLLAQMRGTSTESGTLEVGGARCCGFFTQWGDGVFPVRTELDSEGGLVRIVVELGTKEAVRNLRAVNGL
ncbi:MAG: hypothetical protein QM723_10770 [Myxococcaceae bacterium]